MAKNDASAPKVYRVVHPHPAFHPNLLGQEFEHGVLKTEDADLAKAEMGVCGRRFVTRLHTAIPH